MTTAKARAQDFAVLGGHPAFTAQLPVGQLYFASWDRYEAAMRSIFDRQYYTNHGPAVQQLEERLQGHFGVRNVLTVSNATVGLYLAAKAIGLRGKAIMPAFTFVATAQALSWAGVEPVFCDVERDTHQISPATAEPALGPGVDAVVGVNLWGGTCDPPLMESWAQEQELELVFDSAQAFGCETRSGRLGAFGRAEVFSFHATKILSAAEGGCITTDDDDLAERIRNMRSNYGIRAPREVPLTINARMSEAQAALALMSLDGFDAHRSRNEELWQQYRESLEPIPGLALVKPASVAATTHQYLVCEIEPGGFGMTRDELLTVLRAEGVLARRYFFPGVHRTLPYAEAHTTVSPSLDVTDAVCRAVIQLPVGARVTSADVGRIAQLLRDAHRFASSLRSAVAAAAVPHTASARG